MLYIQTFISSISYPALFYNDHPCVLAVCIPGNLKTVLFKITNMCDVQDFWWPYANIFWNILNHCISLLLMISWYYLILHIILYHVILYYMILWLYCIVPPFVLLYVLSHIMFHYMIIFKHSLLYLFNVYCILYIYYDMMSYYSMLDSIMLFYIVL